MKVAILGADEVTLAVMQAVSRHPDHQLTAIAEWNEGPAAGELGRSGFPIRKLDSWEQLLDPALADLVVVASGDEERRADQVRKFAQAEIPVLAAHPLFLSMFVYYELDMIAQDNRSLLLTYLPDRSHPAAVELGRLFGGGATGPLGSIEQVVFERRQTDRSKLAVVAQFARDVDILRSICGEFSRVSAGGGTGLTMPFASLSVQLSGPAGVPVRWSVAPPDDSPSGRLMLLGTAGRAVVSIPDGSAPCRFELTVSGNRMDRELGEAWQPADAMLALAADAVEHSSATRPLVSPSWQDATRSVELMQTIDRSLLKGRTIELHQEDHSEQGTFKGLMAAMGCGVLMAGLMLLVVIALVEDLGRANGRRGPLAANWPLFLLALLGVFLVLQLLVLVFRPKKSGN